MILIELYVLPDYCGKRVEVREEVLTEIVTRCETFLSLSRKQLSKNVALAIAKIARLDFGTEW